MVDADHFKSINDTYGHNGGDDVLKHLSSHIQRLFRQTDLCVRWGGEEFLVVLAGGDASQARAVVERFRHSIENNPHEGNGQKIAYTVTVGLASFVPGHFSLALEQADQALYHGKKTGRNRVVSFWEL